MTRDEMSLRNLVTMCLGMLSVVFSGCDVFSRVYQLMGMLMTESERGETSGHMTKSSEKKHRKVICKLW